MATNSLKSPKKKKHRKNHPEEPKPREKMKIITKRHEKQK